MCMFSQDLSVFILFEVWLLYHQGNHVQLAGVEFFAGRGFFTNGVNLWHLLLCWYPKCIFLPINYTCFGRGLFCQRISWKKKLLIHNNINYYCEHFVCNLGSAACVFEKKKIWARGHSQVCLSRIMWTGFLSNLTIFVSLLNKGFKKPLSCRIVASCLM